MTKEIKSERQNIKIVLIEDSTSDARIIYELLEDNKSVDYTIKWHTTLAAGLDHLKTSECDIIFSDMHLPDAAGLHIVEMIYHSHPNIPIIALSRIYDKDTEWQSKNLGAQDFLLKDGLDGILLTKVIKYAIDRCRREYELRKSRESLQKIVWRIP
ncbi:response regulator [bacterium]|nr:response regulator [bacterium]MBU1064090.1 response regulator [bacterium]MBU1635545.1 response regulator [bacterium]MBU1874127.1 response regulator [bacterium]